MAKLRKCNMIDCDLPRMKRPGNTTIHFKFCQVHQIKHVLAKQKESAVKDKAGLEKMRETKKKTPVERFYSSSAWRNCSRYVLLHYSDDDLMVRCSTSPHLIYHVTDKAIHCGHFHKADQHKATAFDIKNLCPQSYSDNVHFSGKPEVMAEWIEKTHGKGTIEYLDIRKNETLKLDKHELNLISKYYLNLFNNELEKRGIKSPWK